jgi:hypothetical protein
MAERPCLDVVSAMLPPADEVDALRCTTPRAGVLTEDTREAPVDVRCVAGKGLAPEAAILADGESGPTMVLPGTRGRSAAGVSPMAVRVVGCRSTWIATLPCAGARLGVAAARAEVNSSEARVVVTSVKAAGFEEVS